ncbi:MAG: Glyoxalase/bleomycin resistance protein/dioxygenase [Pedosphaera sp.]|nr:Glyoxalase/bleomycin resistance protein/dioxygenase [Pedosphaera sp.]
MEPRISLITLGVTDLPRAIRFYRDGLGFPTKAKDDADIAFFNTTGTKFGLYPLDKLAEDISPSTPTTRSQFSGITLSHNVRQKEEVAQVLALAESAGGRILKPAQDVFWGGHCGYFVDPDGHHWEVAWNPHFPLAADGSLIIDG